MDPTQSLLFMPHCFRFPGLRPRFRFEVKQKLFGAHAVTLLRKVLKVSLYLSSLGPRR